MWNNAAMCLYGHEIGMSPEHKLAFLAKNALLSRFHAPIGKFEITFSKIIPVSQLIDIRAVYGFLWFCSVHERPDFHNNGSANQELTPIKVNAARMSGRRY